MKLHVHTFTWICGLVGCQPSSVAINFLDHVTKWAPHAVRLEIINNLSYGGLQPELRGLVHNVSYGPLQPELQVQFN